MVLTKPTPVEAISRAAEKAKAKEIETETDTKSSPRLSPRGKGGMVEDM
jgi:hypothetical protein